jgi:hypothetical protein
VEGKMTVPLEFANIRVETLVRGFSRYKESEVLYWGNQRRIAFGTYLRKPYTPTGKERVMLVTPGLEYRPDLVAYDVYGFPDGWWKIMEVNKIYDIWDFKAGITIMLPDSLL